MGVGIDRAKGRAKEVWGSVTGNKSLRRRGRVEQTVADVKGKANHAVGRVRHAFHR